MRHSLIVRGVARRSAALLAVAVAAMVVLAGAAALAEPAETAAPPAPFEGNYLLRAEAYGGRLLFNLPHYIVVDPLVQGSVPRAFAELASSGSLAEASSIDVGPPEYLPEGAPALVVGLSVSGPAYPLLARARNDGTDETKLHLATEYGQAGVGRAVAGPTVASADATAYDLTFQGGSPDAPLWRRSLARLEAGLPAPLRTRRTAPEARGQAPALARFASVSQVSLSAPADGVPALARSRSDIGRLEALGGLLVVEGVETEVRVEADGRSDASVAPAARLARAHFGEIEVAIDRKGVHVQDTVAGKEELDAALQRALADARVSVTAPGVRTERLDDGTTRVVSEGIRVQFLFDVPSVNPDNVLAVSLGGSEAVFAVEAAGGSPRPETLAPSSPPMPDDVAAPTANPAADPLSRLDATAGATPGPEGLGPSGDGTGEGFALLPDEGLVPGLAVDTALGTGSSSELTVSGESGVPVETALAGSGVSDLPARAGASTVAPLLPAVVAADVRSLAILPIIAVMILVGGVLVLRLRL